MKFKTSLSLLACGLCWRIVRPCRAHQHHAHRRLDHGGRRHRANGPGYRGPLYNSLIANEVSFAYEGINTNNNGPTTGLPSLPAGYLNHNGYGSYTPPTSIPTSRRTDKTRHRQQWRILAHRRQPDHRCLRRRAQPPRRLPRHRPAHGRHQRRGYSNGTDLTSTA